MNVILYYFSLIARFSIFDNTEMSNGQNRNSGFIKDFIDLCSL